MTSIPSRADWGFEDIRAQDRRRAERLEACEPPDQLIPALVKSIQKNVWEATVEPSKRDLSCRRAVVQFRVDPKLYDWFYNARTGYRAQFWISPEHGIRFNHVIAGALAEVLSSRIDPSSLSSIRHPEAKIWICEDRSVFCVAYSEKSAKLNVPRWAKKLRGEGLRAPFPAADESWLEMKGAFLQEGGVFCPSEKPKDKRARALHQTGWT